MFDRFAFFGPAPGALRAALASVVEAGAPTLAAVLLAADRPDEVLARLPEVALAKVPIVGAVFPRLIHDRQVVAGGGVVLAFDRPTKRVAIDEVARRSDAELEAHIRELFISPNVGSRHTVLALADQRVVGAPVSACLELLHMHFQLRSSYIGGGAGYADLADRPSLFTEAGFLERGLLLVRVEGSTAIRVQHGWSPLAGPFFASKTDDRAVLELDWRPAVEVYREALAALGHDVPATGSGFAARARHFPLAIAKLRDNWVVRDPIAATPDGAILTLGAVPAHSIVSIVSSTPAALIAAAERAAVEARSAAPDAKTAFVVDCVSRTDVLGPDFARELSAVRDGLGFEAVGILSLGEIASNGDQFLEFYNKTCVVGAR